jgi:hypothetical protein
MDLLSDNQKKVVMWHELRHTGISTKGMKLQPHEIEDFESIAERLGIKWADMGRDVIDILEGGENGKGSQKESKKKKHSKKESYKT